MGHDLITIYWIKAVEYVLALSYLPLFVLFWRFVTPKREAAAAVHAASPGWADQLAGFFQVPADLLFHPGHTWVRLEGGDTVTVGVTDFAQKLVGPLGRLDLPAVGTTLVQGEPAFLLDADGGSIPMLAPVDGKVVAVNTEADWSPDAVKRAPYGEGWLLKIKSPKLSSNVKHLLSGSLARRWMDTVCESLGAEMAPAELGRVYLDGGAIVDGLARNLAQDEWPTLARRFFLTEEGGRND
jgi:glycine cleavage system H protein